MLAYEAVVRGPRRARLHVLGLAMLGAIVACGSTLPGPSIGRHPEGDFILVDYPPPAPLPEQVPSSPRPEAVWVDGHYRWIRGDWQWEAGMWTVPPPGSEWAPPELIRMPDASLRYAPPAWRGPRGELIDPPEPLAKGTPPTGPDTEGASESP